ncbi:MAG: enoyl-CoA hydratase/isomerase family protein [Deltaproteobacteria bacterium]|nr:enoyl-CoA hydratase/isomerase family protein [Deltaproteobacteria bacterium]
MAITKTASSDGIERKHTRLNCHNAPYVRACYLANRRSYCNCYPQPAGKPDILTGAGRAFSSGGNLDMIESRTRKKEATNKKELKMFYRIFLDVRNLKIPVIAAVNGHAIGAGFCLALACDLRYASLEAKMGANFAKIGLAPGMGGTWLITRLIGPTRAAEVLLLAENLSAKRAFDMGLLNGVFEADKLLPHVHGVAKVIAENGPMPVVLIKKGIQKALHGTLEQMFDYDSACQAKTFTTEDIKEGIRAIREKRSPLFQGK